MDSAHPTKMYSWKEILPRMEEIRAEATEQFIDAWKNSQARYTHDFTWHETMGYVIVKRDDANKRIILSPRCPELLKEMGLVFDPGLVGAHPKEPKACSSARPLEEATETHWRPAHARFALRCEPLYLRKFSLEQLAIHSVECLRERRRIIKSMLDPDEMLLSIGQFPLLGAGTYIDHQTPPNGPLLRSQLLSDICLNPTPPFTLEIGGIVDRRGVVPYTGVPIYHDTNTPWPFVDESMPFDPFSEGIMMPTGESNRDSACSVASSPVADMANRNTTKDNNEEARSTAQSVPALSRPLLLDPPSNKNCLLLDSPLFGIGSGGVLRVTLCAADLDEARVLHDHLAPIGAIMAALTAATPIVKGHLVDRDCYWDVQCSTVDDRSAQERGIVPLTTAKGTLLKSRYGSIDTYLGPIDPQPEDAFRRQYNDNQFTYDKGSYWKMREGCGIDNLLALHVSRLFVRDIHYASEYMFESSSSGEKSNMADGQEHFKRFLGCSRQNVCLYPPNKHTGSGWEVEFMSLEVQLTDEENAAFITFIVLLSRVIISYRLNLYLPITLMDHNMARSQKINAAREQLFFFRRDVFGGRDGKSNGSGRISKRISKPGAWHTAQHSNGSSRPDFGIFSFYNSDQPETAEYVELTVDEIINGSETYRVTGLLNIMFNYLHTLRLEYDVEQALRRQLLLVKKRASGKLCTLATWMRNFVHKHPDYRQDSVVSQSINYDMLRTMNDIEEGKVTAPELL
ncbi:glutamate--cysteine ligase [Coemansia sp. RSA 989]|nr:glutamate-cysteine ligase-domain-containing protein [Coemansia mojavensis]KAJ1867025.1 glutamate--cysteine ligase [Coemansia sp. RSA 989]